MGFWLKLIIIYVVLAILVVLAMGFEARTGLDLLFLLLAFIPHIVKNTPRLYLLYQRGLNSALNRETTWDICLSLDGEFDAKQVEEFVNEIVRENHGNSALLERNNSRHLFKFRRMFTVEILLSDNNVDMVTSLQTPLSQQKYHHFDLSIFEQQVSYRKSRHMIEKVIVPFFEQIKDRFHPYKGKFTLKVDFEKTNPFFGLYLQQMKLENIREFNIKFTVPLGNSEDYVQLAKQNMTVVASTLEGLRSAAISGLNFSLGRR